MKVLQGQSHRRERHGSSDEDENDEEGNVEDVSDSEPGEEKQSSL